MKHQRFETSKSVSTASFWDAVSSEYPESLSILYPKKKEFDRALVPQWRSGRMLDAGSGKGSDALYFSSRFEEVYAVDHSREMTELARETIRVSGLKSASSVKVQTEDIRVLPFDDGYFDVTCSFSVIDHIPDRAERERAVRELFRVTKPGGLLVLTFPNRDSLPAMLRRHKEFVVRPGKFDRTDFVEVVSRAQCPGCLEYQYEATYSWDVMESISSQFNLERCEIRSGVMTNCVRLDRKEETTQRRVLDENTEFLITKIEGQQRPTIDNTYNEWLRLPTYRRGIRLGLVGERPAA